MYEDGIKSSIRFVRCLLQAGILYAITADSTANVMHCLCGQMSCYTGIIGSSTVVGTFTPLSSGLPIMPCNSSHTYLMHAQVILTYFEMHLISKLWSVSTSHK